MSATRPGHVGPNAVTRVAEALDALEGPALCDAVFAAADLTAYRASPPLAMVPEAEVAALQAALVLTCGRERAAAIAREAGHRTGDYRLARRIPRTAQAALRLMPRRWSSRILARAIARHAWTFAGSGSFSLARGNGLVFRLVGSPVCRDLRTGEPAGHYLAATLERIFSHVVDPAARVRELSCISAGDAVCEFHLDCGGSRIGEARPRSP